MSPMFGVGVNYAIQDAVALANAISGDLRFGFAPSDTLAAVQKRREKPVATMQRLQRIGQNAIAKQRRGRRIAPRWALRALRVLSPIIRPLAARFIGLGLGREHVSPALRRQPRDAR